MKVGDALPRCGTKNRDLGLNPDLSGSGGNAEMNEFGLQLSEHADGQQADCDRELEATRAAGAGIEIEHSLLRDEIGDVGVAVEDSGEFGCGGIEVQGFEVVKHVDVEAGVGRVLDEHDFGFGQLDAGTFAVDIAANGCDGSDLGELGQYRGIADVADMQDTVDTFESGGDFRAKETVGIGDDSELHVLRISRAGGGRLREGTYAN
jgi:hypothetical protein